MVKYAVLPNTLIVEAPSIALDEKSGSGKREVKDIESENEQCRSSHTYLPRAGPGPENDSWRLIFASPLQTCGSATTTTNS